MIYRQLLGGGEHHWHLLERLLQRRRKQVLHNLSSNIIFSFHHFICLDPHRVEFCSRNCLFRAQHQTHLENCTAMHSIQFFDKKASFLGQVGTQMPESRNFHPHSPKSPHISLPGRRVIIVMNCQDKFLCGRQERRVGSGGDSSF